MNIILKFFPWTGFRMANSRAPCPVLARPLAKKTASLIEKETKIKANIES